ncbi:MAG: DUF362 domain-containing protein [Candidatus Helarchaeota archaeon]
MGRPIWFVKLVQLLYKQKKFVAKLTNFPIIGDLIDKMVFENDHLYCLPKDNVIQLNTTLTPQEVMLPSKVAEIFVENTQYHWIMNFCICRHSNHCKDYPINYGCLFLGEAAMHINPKLGRRVTKAEALTHLKKCREAGLVHFIGRVKGDSMWLGVHPEQKLLTICNCCPCCCISGLIKDLAPQIAMRYHKVPGVTVTISDHCVGCGTCVNICFVNAIQIINKKARIESACRGCGRCVEKCPHNAIQLTINDNQFIQKTVDNLSKYVNLV